MGAATSAVPASLQQHTGEDGTIPPSPFSVNA